jgi:hypothetical protein
MYLPVVLVLRLRTIISRLQPRVICSQDMSLELPKIFRCVYSSRGRTLTKHCVTLISGLFPRLFLLCVPARARTVRVVFDFQQDFEQCKAKLIERGEQFAETALVSRQKILRFGDRFIHDGTVRKQA